jgi:hypothetical protein
MKRLGLIILIGSLCLILFSHAQANITGPHNIQHIKGVCANCHIPHHAKGDKIWARKLLQNFGGVRQLCNSCHDGTFSKGIDPNDPSSPEVESGIKTVFGTRYESHVMHEAAVITKDDWLGTYDKESFPLDPNDEDSVSGHPDDWDRGGAGFYCGSCHNPHIQPEGKEDGDYLRAGSKDIGEPGNRSPFCKQCHDPGETGNSHLTSDNCQACHHPHEGYEKAQIGMTDNELKIARLILKDRLGARFIAQPNVPAISEDPNDRTFISSFFCYGCHQSRHVLDPSDPNNNFWRENGAAPIYGDQVDEIEIKNNTQRRNHHPMGTQARLSGSSFLRAGGAEATEHLNKNGELTCISCHADFHGLIDGKDYNQSKENNFLRWDFTNDDAGFCIKCHSDKIIVNDGKHFWDTNAPITRKIFDRNATNQDYEKPVSCRQCMFCHFIHDGEERDNESVSGFIKADMDALMRIGPENLAWGDRTDDTDLNDYEDMCYGCHSNESIVGGGCNNGALLKWSNDIHTHRFASAPDPNNPPSMVIKYGGVFPLSDGKGTVTKNDYGTQQDTIFCGTCHKVHNGRISPYLNHESTDVYLSPYKPYGFCEECHDAESNEFKFVHNSHPIDKAPNYSATAETWPELFYSGGSGCRGGVTLDESDSGEIICLTCHNVHAAATSHNGMVIGKNDNTHGFLLIKDNMLMSTPGGSDMCQGCHPF